jgi:hypothetical protein
MRAKRRYRLPLVVTLHTSHFLKLAQKPAWQPVLRRIIRRRTGCWRRARRSATWRSACTRTRGRRR